MAALACQQRPGAAPAPTAVRRTVFALAISIVVIPTPGRTVGCLNFQHGINDTERVLNNRIVCTANAVTYQFQKASINDLFCREFIASARRLVGKYQSAAIRVLIGAIDRAGGIDTDVVTPDSRHEGSFGRHSPGLYVRFEKISIIANELGSSVLATVIKELRSANERRNVYGESGWGIPSGLLPAILRCDRPFADEKATGATNHLKRKEISQSFVLPESPCQ